MLQKLKNWLKRGDKTLEISSQNIPAHVAIIMDGNGRWAKKRGLPRIAGHRAGMKAVKEVTIAADNLGIKVLTLYAFSTENWKRPKDEVEFLMKLPQEFLSVELNELVEKNVQIRMLGSEEGLPNHTLQAIREAQKKTQNNTGLILNFALNYGSRAEIVDMVRHVAEQVKDNTLDLHEIDESTVSQFLQTKNLVDPDLLIRTKEIRLSNFMLWQIAYAELWFTDVYWPDFNRKHFEEAIMEYQRRTRRYGSVQP
jgi:undecaprenyl diphosphate synthase